jgi:hypothetical protein
MSRRWADVRRTVVIDAALTAAHSACVVPRPGRRNVSVWVSRRFRVAEATRHIAIDKSPLPLIPYSTIMNKSTE